MDPRKSTEHERSVTLIREFDVPARFLFRAFSTPEHLKQWFGPPGYPLTLCEVDFRVGGRFRFAMTGPDGAQMPAFGGEYLTIEPDREIKYTNRFEAPGAETMIVTIALEERGSKTRLTQHTLFASIAMKEAHMQRGYEAGVRAGFDQLAAVLAAEEST